MKLVVGVLLILWGVIVLFSSLFKMKDKDYKNLGISGELVWDALFALLSKFPKRVYKGFVASTGIALIVIGVVVL